MQSKSLTPTWKKNLIIALCVISVAGLIFACLMANVYYDKYHKSHYWENLARPISENVLMVDGYKGGESFVRLKDIRTGKYVTPKLQHIFLNEFNTEDSLVVFRTFDKLRGYLNIHTGEIVIPAQYNRAWNFSEGIAGVLKDGVVSFIKEDGELAFDKTFPIYYDDDYSEIAFQFHHGLCVMRTMDNKWGLINTEGEWAVEPVYTTISAPRKGYRIVSDGNLYGLISGNGQIVLPLEYDFIRLSSNPAGFTIAKDGIAKTIDYDLKTVVPFVYDGLYVLPYVDEYRSNVIYENGEVTKYIVPKYWRYDVGSGSGVIDLEGNVIIPAKYFMVRIVDDNLFDVEVSYEGEHILINSKGQIVG